MGCFRRYRVAVLLLCMVMLFLILIARISVPPHRCLISVCTTATPSSCRNHADTNDDICAMKRTLRSKASVVHRSFEMPRHNHTIVDLPWQENMGRYTFRSDHSPDVWRDESTIKWHTKYLLDSMSKSEGHVAVRKWPQD